MSNVASDNYFASTRNYLALTLDYISLMKPKATFLLSLTGLCAVLAARSSLTPAKWVLAIAMFVLATGGANSLTNFVDRDIDALMLRTKLRPLPAGRIPPLKALQFGLACIAASLAIALYLNPLTAAFLLAGVLGSVIVYNYFTKRKTWLNVLFGAPAGAMPTLGGWALATGSVSWEAIFMAVLVVLWTPMHIWSLAFKYRDDYIRARVPMLPAVIRSKIDAARAVAVSALPLIALSFIASYVPGFGQLFRVTLLATGAILLFVATWLFAFPSERGAWTLFKVSSPYLAVVFVAWVLDAYFPI